MEGSSYSRGFKIHRVLGNGKLDDTIAKLPNEKERKTFIRKKKQQYRRKKVVVGKLLIISLMVLITF